MRNIKRIIISVMLVFALLVQFDTTAFALTDTQKQNIEKILGVYDGNYTAPQGITGLTLAVYRKQELLENDTLLEMYAKVANSCGDSYTNTSKKKFTATDIKTIISNHTDEYIALFNYFPMVNENGVGPNPDVEEGLYTMSVNYNEATGKYEFIGRQWIQHDTYKFVDLKNVVFNEDKITGDVYGKTDSWLGTDYKDVGDVLVSTDKGHAGYRIEFVNDSLSVGINKTGKLDASVKNADGTAATEAVNIRWFSSDEKILKVTGTGWSGKAGEYAVATVTGISEGIAYVYAELDNKRVVGCTVVVSKNGTIAPLEITTSYELISQMNKVEKDGILIYRYEPTYKITATVKNADVNKVNNITVRLNLPQIASLSGGGQLIENVEKLNANESKTLVWNIKVHTDAKYPENVQYSISALSNQTAESVTHKTIFVDSFMGKDNRIDYDTDVWDFNNTDSKYGKGYFINSKYYEALMNAVNNIEKERIDNSLKEKWGGSCYGMVVVSALTKLGHLTPGEYYSGATVLKDLPMPKKDDGIYSLITYYHMTQQLDSYYSAREECLNLTEKERLIALINAAEAVKTGKEPVLLCFWYMNKDYDVCSVSTDYFSGHAVLAYDVEYGSYEVKSYVDKTKSVYDKRILLYDPNNNKEPIYFYVNSDCSKWIIDGYCQNRTKDDGLFWYKNEGNFIFIEDSEVMDSIHVKDSILNYKARLTAYNNTKLKIKTDKKEYVVHGLNIFTGLNKELLAYVEGLTGDGYSKGFGYFIPDGVKDVCVSPEAGDGALDMTYQYSGILYGAKAQNSKSVSFTNDKRVELDCNGEYVLTAIYNESKYATPWYSYTVSGLADGKVSLSLDKEGYTVISGENLDGVKLTVKGKNGEESCEIKTSEDRVMIKDENGRLALYADTDDDGTFEAGIDTTGASNKNPSGGNQQGVKTKLFSNNMLGFGIGIAVIVVALISAIVIVIKKKRKE